VKISGSDHVAGVRAEWAREWPELDTEPIDVVARIGRLAQFLDDGLNRVFAPHGIRREGWDVLASLRRAGPPYRASPTVLYRRLMRTSGAMTNRLHRLERAGLIARVPDPEDARGRLVELTSAGHRLVEELAPLHLANERALLAALTVQEQRELAALLAKLLAAFEAEVDRRGADREGRVDGGRPSAG
jgi:DNA-binding MarR family transcriptional regulator